MGKHVASLIVAAIILGITTYAQDYTKLHFQDCGSKSADIQKVDMIPMPLYNPGPSWFTFITVLKRQISKYSIDLYKTRVYE